MTILDKYREAYNKMIEAQGECTHWDYEYSEGQEYPCCIEMRRAQQIALRWSKATKQTRAVMYKAKIESGIK